MDNREKATELTRMKLNEGRTGDRRSDAVAWSFPIEDRVFIQRQHAR
jgi:hypothetical protein